MASYIKTLKEDNGDITYPQTLGSAVLLSGGADLETTLASKADATTVAGKIDIGDVQTTDIVNGAVTASKIDFSSFGCIETSFYFENKSDNTYVDVTTNKGTAIRIAFVSNGTPFIVSGGSNIKMAEVKVGANFSSSVTTGYEVCGVGSGSIYTRCFHQFTNGAGGSTETNTTASWSAAIGGVTVSGGTIGSVGAGTKTSFFAAYTVIKSGTGTVIFGTASSDGSLTGMSFDVHHAAVPTGIIPGILQGAAASVTSSNVSYIKIYESNS